MRIYKDRGTLPGPNGFEVTLPNGETLRASSYFLLLRSLRTELIRLNINVPDVEIYMNDLICQQLSKSGRDSYCVENGHIADEAYNLMARYDANAAGKIIPPTVNGADAGAWRTWHIMALDGKLTKDMIQSLVNRIGCGTCRTHARAYTSKVEFVDGWDRDRKFQWTVDFHNHVNRTLGKSIIKFEDAKRIWAK